MIDELPPAARPGGEPIELPGQYVAEPTQLFQGLTFGSLVDDLGCLTCGNRLQVGAMVTCYGYRRAESITWELGRCRCPDCTVDEIAAPTLGVTELLLKGQLGLVTVPGRRDHRLCLTGVVVLGYSPPEAGGR